MSVSQAPLPCSWTDLLRTKKTYQHVADDFHVFHRHDLNVFLHVITTTLGVWGAIHLAIHAHHDVPGIYAVYLYAAWTVLTTPLSTGILHTLLVVVMCVVATPLHAAAWLPYRLGDTLEPCWLAICAIVLGYGLQDLAHYLTCEPTFMNAYLKKGQWWMLPIHSLWLLPLVIDSLQQRHFFFPLVVSRNRNVITKVASRTAVDQLRDWIQHNVPITKETTHIWPHQQDGTAAATVALENDEAIEAAFRTVFSAVHYDVRPVPRMNEIYVTAVGAQKSINSDAVFYTPHTDGPYWWLPGASLYRVLVGVTPNQMVRTRFNLQHTSQDQVLDLYGVVGFDYNRELHWIDHVPHTTNPERRSLLKLHFVVYPAGWHRYGTLCARLNATYNTWARGNFLRTLRPAGGYEHGLAWWIWLTTWFNAGWEQHVGWSNLVYVAAAYYLWTPPLVFLVLTSFRHYLVYICTFAFRQPMVAHGYLMRDAKLYKTLSMLHLAHRLLPLIQLPRDVWGLCVMALGFGTTLLATARLGMVRTYFGTELGFVKPKWIEGFPYGTIPHPMIMGQVFGFAVILYWWRNEISVENTFLLKAHITCYLVHMFQEIVFSAYQ